MGVVDHHVLFRIMFELMERSEYKLHLLSGIFNMVTYIFLSFVACWILGDDSGLTILVIGSLIFSIGMEYQKYDLKKIIRKELEKNDKLIE